MSHTRTFFGASSRVVISIVLALKFCGEGGLMVASTADSEEDSIDGTQRFMKNFKPLGTSLISRFAGSFHVRQELLEWSPASEEARASFRISFAPARATRAVPAGSFLWEIESGGGEKAVWREFINTQETRAKQLPDLRVPRKWIFLFGHNRLMNGAARRVVEVLNAGETANVVFAKYAEADRFNFWPAKS